MMMNNILHCDIDPSPDDAPDDVPYHEDYTIVNGAQAQPGPVARLLRRGAGRLRFSVVAMTIIVLVVAILLTAAVSPGVRSLLNQYTHRSPTTLRYRRVEDADSDSVDQWVFTVLQLADIHLGEAQNTDWGPQQDVKTWAALEFFLGKNSQVYDLIVLSGDQLTANDFKSHNATKYYLELGRRVAQYNVPFSFIFGNHDDQPNGDTGVSATSRMELLQVMQQHFPHLCRTQRGPSNVTGLSNYWLNIHSPKLDSETQDNDMLTRMVFLDSGGGLLPQQIDESHLSFLIQGNALQSSVPTMAFSHIPTKEYTYSTDYCVGENNDGGFAAPTSGDAGLVSTLQQNLPNVFVLAVGHNHGNDYCCVLDGTGSTSNSSQLRLCFGRHSGYGGYGTWDRGVRMYQFQLNSSTKKDNEEKEVSYRKFSWKSWVFMESGEVQDTYGPFELG